MKFIKSKYLGYSVLLFFIFFLGWSLGPMQAIQQKLSNTIGNKEMLDLKPYSSFTEVYDYVAKVGPAGHKVLSEMYTYQDLVFPIAYGLFFVFALLYFISRSFIDRKKMLWFSLPAFLMMIADYLENFSILAVISNPTEKLTIAIYVGIFTGAKWILGIVAIIILLVFALIFIFKKISLKKSRIE